MTVVILIAAALLIWITFLFNSLVRKRNMMQNAWSDVDVQLKRRYDLIPNLVETVKGYKNYEAAVLEEVTSARTSAMSMSGGGEAKSQAENQLSGALKSLFAVAENYPDLKASANFQKLQDELSSLENDIQSARRFYNAAAREFNNAVQVFPSNLVAGTLGFKRAEFFGADDGEQGAVNVSF